MTIKLKPLTHFVRHRGLTTILILVCSFLTGQAQSPPGSITDSYSRAMVNGQSMVGGLAGSVTGGVQVLRTYSTGMVRGGTEGIGGLIGGQTGQTDVSASYWDMESSGLEQSAAGQGRTTPQMIDGQAHNTYQGWDFTQVWHLDTETRNSGYPYLKQSPPVTYILQLQTNIPEAGTVAGAGQYGQGTTVSLKATANQGFSFVNWRDSGNQEVSSNETFDFTMPAEHVSITAQFTGPTSISDKDLFQPLVYPNPFGNTLYINPGSSFHDVSFYNVFGQKVLVVALDGSPAAIDTKSLSTGLYLMVFQGIDGAMTAKKVIRQ